MKDMGQYPIGIFLHHQSGIAFLISRMAFLSITSMYLYEFIVPQLAQVKLLLKN